MAINSLVRRASFCSIIPGVVAGQSLGIFSTSSTATTNNLSSPLASSELALDALTNPAHSPFELKYSNDEKGMGFYRNVGSETHILEVYGATIDPIPNVLMNVRILKNSHRMHFDVTAEPNRFHIHSLVMSDQTYSGHLRAFEGYLGTKGINGRTIGILLNCFRKQQPKD